mmetsp:Transcript_21230/g.68514  ORF Transcript_21230/g.68514 Transcript_21230/m.68514 type:complete len:380 (+) Transcript_21230:44-1183(+)
MRACTMSSRRYQNLRACPCILRCVTRRRCRHERSSRRRQRTTSADSALMWEDTDTCLAATPSQSCAFCSTTSTPVNTCATGADSGSRSTRSTVRSSSCSGALPGNCDSSSCTRRASARSGRTARRTSATCGSRRKSNSSPRPSGTSWDSALPLPPRGPLVSALAIARATASACSVSAASSASAHASASASASASVPVAPTAAWRTAAPGASSPRRAEYEHALRLHAAAASSDPAASSSTSASSSCRARDASSVAAHIDWLHAARRTVEGGAPTMVPAPPASTPRPSTPGCASRSRPPSRAGTRVAPYAMWCARHSTRVSSSLTRPASTACATPLVPTSASASASARARASSWPSSSPSTAIPAPVPAPVSTPTSSNMAW